MKSSSSIQVIAAKKPLELAYIKSALRGCPANQSALDQGQQGGARRLYSLLSVCQSASLSVCCLD